MEQIITSADYMEDRILYLSSDVTDITISDICKRILTINEFDRKNDEKFKNYVIRPIQLHVQSFGGSVYDMWALIDIMESSNTPIITYCSGYCMSAASLIFLAGHVRCMYKHSVIMLHQMQTWLSGKINDVRLEQKQMDNLHKQMNKFLKKRTNLSKKLFNKINERKEEVYLNAKECLKFGICDEIVTKIDWRTPLLESMKSELND